MTRKKRPKIDGYSLKEGDFIENRMTPDSAIQYGLCEIQGRRLTQEDAMGTSSSIGVNLLPCMTNSAILASYGTTFSELQNEFGEIDTIGTTCCTVTAWIDPTTRLLKAYTGNLGDSAAYLIRLKQNGEVSTEQLTALHEPLDAEEFKRLVAFKEKARREGQLTDFFLVTDTKKNLRLGGSLKLSRGFGDIDYEKYGFSHQPEIKAHEFLLEESEVAYIIVGCDGLMEKALKPSDLGKILEANQERTPMHIAEAMVNAAYNQGRIAEGEYQGSCDNISCGVFQVSELPGSMTILDGHGGNYKGKENAYEEMTASDLALDIGQNFYPMLEQNLQMNALYDLTNTFSIRELLEIIPKLFPGKEQRMKFKQKLCAFQIEHANRIYEQQMLLFAKPEEQKALEKECMSKGSIKKANGNVHAILPAYQEESAHDNACKYGIIPMHIDESDNENVAGEYIARYFLENIKEVIESTRWKLHCGGTPMFVENNKGALQTLPKHMAAMMGIINEITTLPDLDASFSWRKAFNKIVEVGIQAASKQSCSFFGIGKRSRATQKFYSHFLAAAANASARSAAHQSVHGTRP